VKLLLTDSLTTLFAHGLDAAKAIATIAAPTAHDIHAWKSLHAQSTGSTSILDTIYKYVFKGPLIIIIFIRQNL
jgi:hypothetical protein